MSKKKSQREKDLTSRYYSGDFDEDRYSPRQQFTARSKNAQQNRLEKTAQLRQDENSNIDLAALPTGEVIQVHSLFCEVQHEGKVRLAITRKTLQKLSDTQVVVGDFVKFSRIETDSAAGQPEAIIEQVLPRRTLLTRSDSFKGIEQHPIVSNAEQMLIVASIILPDVRWGLIDRMLVAAQAGGLSPVICLNKADLATGDKFREQREEADVALALYEKLGIRSLRTSVEQNVGIDELRNVLKDHITVLAGHSGVGKSSLIRAVQSDLDLRIGAISGYTNKGRHTTTSARRYPLAVGGAVVDTPGVKLFGLWGVTEENLGSFFPDIEDDTAPDWRKESYQRIKTSLEAFVNRRERGEGGRRTTDVEQM